ncbi:hypothetical protein SO802_012416 [Lithocarpus litseifolius]|uniref:Pentatricopeptide repeat-containing protein n=1 Tax=Lithocarpus litseifolius TaxID=425828 RepID=A0AAW2D6R4_9ROSI
MNGLCNAGRPGDALVLWNEMGREGCSPNNIAFMALIHGLCKCGRPDTALVDLHQMQEKEMEPDTFVYVALMSSFLCNLNLPLAFEILKEMAGKGTFQIHWIRTVLLLEMQYLSCRKMPGLLQELEILLQRVEFLKYAVQTSKMKVDMNLLID